MFLFSGQGYWQEFIESIVWSHIKLKVVPIPQSRALSISKGRAVGVTHFSVGKIGCTWTFSLSRLVNSVLVLTLKKFISSPHGIKIYKLSNTYLWTVLLNYMF